MPVTRASQSLSIRKGSKSGKSVGSIAPSTKKPATKAKPIYGTKSIYATPFTKG